MTPVRSRALWPNTSARILTILALLLCACQARADAVSLAQLRTVLSDGDLIFQESRSAQSAAVRAATGSRYSHMGLVFGVAEGHPFVLEAVQPVKRTPLAAWLARGHEGHFVLMRLARPLSADDARKLQSEAERFTGRDYDARFEWSDERMYCSELVWKAYESALSTRLCEPEPWKALHLSDARVKALAKKRLGRMPDPEAPVVTPVRVMQSPLLTRVLAGELH